ncbi:MAG: cyanophycin synthetase [Candidatus Binatia bacterium]
MRAYEESVAFLQALEVSAGWDLGLERVRAALALRGNPEARLFVLHVGGTNGKGSTAAMLESVLRAAGFRTGLYTSPHLVDFAERIRAGGCTIPHDAVSGLVAEQRAAFDAAGLALTHFEFATLLALEWFARIGVEVAVVEVGLGGRLDATNVVQPAATAITSVGYDHEAWLGDSLAAIAAEKAGIIKPGVPVVVGPMPPEARAVVAACATAAGARLRPVGPEALVDTGEGLFFAAERDLGWSGIRLALAGRFQRANAAVALATLACVQDRWPCSPSAVRAGLAGVQWPGRLAVLRRSPLVLADGAHNPEGAAALAAELPALTAGRPLTLVFAVMADKAWPAMLDRLAPLADRIVLTRVGRRGLDPERIAAALPAGVATAIVPDARAAVRGAVAGAPAEGAVVIAGSLFLVGEAYAELAGGAGLSPWNGWKGDGTESAP